MNRIFAILAFAIAWCVSAQIAMACSPPNGNSEYQTGDASSPVPAKNPPKGAIQLKVRAQNYNTAKNDYFTISKINLRVISIANGEFSDKNIILNYSNIDNCNDYFELHDGEFFVTALRMEYKDGSPVFNKNNSQEYGSIFYKSIWNDVPEFDEISGDQKIDKFAEYKPMNEGDFYFTDLGNFNCLEKSGGEYRTWSAEAWRRCVGRDGYVFLECEPKVEGRLICNEADGIAGQRPLELRRDYNVWLHHHIPLAAILLALGLLMGLGYFFHMTTPRRP